MTNHFKATIATLGLVLVGSVVLFARQGDSVKTATAAPTTTPQNDAFELSRTDPTIKVVKTDDEWRRLLTAEQFRVAREAGTERAFTGEYWNNHEHGTYRCVACGLDLFGSDTKFESGTGWPSYWQPLAPDRVKINRDRSWGMVREEVVCARCGSHLGHVFDDGPKPTGKRYCMNSAALKFEKN